MLQTLLVNILIICAILLLIAFLVGAVLLVMIILDVRRSVKKVTNRVNAAAAFFDLAAMFSGLFGLGKDKECGERSERATLKAFAAGLKKGLEVLFKK